MTKQRGTESKLLNSPNSHIPMRPRQISCTQSLEDSTVPIATYQGPKSFSLLIVLVFLCIIIHLKEAKHQNHTIYDLHTKIVLIFESNFQHFHNMKTSLGAIQQELDRELKHKIVLDIYTRTQCVVVNIIHIYWSLVLAQKMSSGHAQFQ